MLILPATFAKPAGCEGQYHRP